MSLSQYSSHPRVLVLWAVFLTGCYSWQVVEPPPGEQKLGRVRAVLVDSTAVELKDAEIHDNALHAIGPKSEFQRKLGEDYWETPVIISLEDIARIEKQRIDSAKSFIGVGAGVGLVLIIYAATSDLNLDFSGPGF